MSRSHLTIAISPHEKAEIQKAAIAEATILNEKVGANINPDRYLSAFCVKYLKIAAAEVNNGNPSLNFRSQELQQI